MPKTLIIQFAKHPKAGHVKTRLIPALGEEGALQAHIELMTLTKEAIQSCDWAEYQFWTDKTFSHIGFPHPDIQFTQQGEDLGEKMAHALHHGQISQYEKVLLVGSDCPIFTQENLYAAAKQLDVTDTVFIPSNDGGYVLIGVNKNVVLDLSGLIWGRETVLEDSIKRVKSLGYSHSITEPLFDVDTIEDYRTWKQLEPTD